jgi:hypothetical protein
MTSAQLQSTANALPGGQLYDTSAGEFNTSVVLPKFDPLIGGPNTHSDLTSVQVAIGWAAIGVVDVFNYNINPAGQPFTHATSAVPVQISVPGGNTLVDTTVVANPTDGFAGFTPVGNVIYDATKTTSGACNNAHPGIATFSAGKCYYVPTPGFAEVSSDPVRYLGDAASPVYTSGLAAFTGTGPYNSNNDHTFISLDIGAGDGLYSGSAAGKVFFSGNAFVGGIVEVVYNYSTEVVPAPEPFSMTLIGAGLFVVGGLVRRRSAGN